MQVSVRTTFAALSLACLAASAGTLSSQPALAQAAKQGSPAQPPAGQPPQLKQVALTEGQIDKVLASQRDMEAAVARLAGVMTARSLIYFPSTSLRRTYG